jgi:hypothetical protein
MGAIRALAWALLVVVTAAELTALVLHPHVPDNCWGHELVVWQCGWLTRVVRQQSDYIQL